ncbi:hypothetical protein HGM15179_005403 [Zosterops borbonicus]|uniref:Uncharacterized protein n=1 Tax=Zosterops borbonicus TaxID=364589 RepID=A0A8K1GMB2_9PASS|nr:hypothetical protein HGM15179_005403 [Zosterops borbonicus]
MLAIKYWNCTFKFRIKIQQKIPSEIRIYKSFVLLLNILEYTSELSSIINGDGIGHNYIVWTKTLANLDKNHFLANARKKFLPDDDANLINSLAISSTLRHNKQNEISIRLTHEIDIRKSFSRNETMRPDEIREGHRKEIRTIQPILDTWTA